MGWEDQPKIVINGEIPLEEHLEEVEKEEQRKQDELKRREIIQETFGQIPAVKGSIYFKPHKVGTPVTKVLNSRVYAVKDQIGYLLIRSGNNDAYTKFLSFTQRKQKQIERLLTLFRRLKDQKFLFADAVKTLRADSFPDPHRYLLMLQQADVLVRHDDNGYVKYSKACVAEYDALVLMINNADKLVGYVSSVKKPEKTTTLQTPTNGPLDTAKKIVFNSKIDSVLSDLVNGYCGGSLESYVSEFLKERFPNRRK